MTKTYDVFGIGTALVDYFIKSDEDFLAKNDLIKGATNFLPREKLDELLRKKIIDSGLREYFCITAETYRTLWA